MPAVPQDNLGGVVVARREPKAGVCTDVIDRNEFVRSVMAYSLSRGGSMNVNCSTTGDPSEFTGTGVAP
jgi:hypothetical protein